jgi:hypothetical protein
MIRSDRDELRELRVEVKRLRAQIRATDAFWLEDHRKLQRRYTEAQSKVERLRSALRNILEDNEARILNDHRDDGWAALGESGHP